MDRREFLAIMGVAGTAGALSGCGPLARRVAPKHAPYAGPARVPPPENVRLVNRTTFGANRESLDRLKLVGKAAFIDEQLRADLPEERALHLQLANLEALALTGVELSDQPQGEVLRQLCQAAIVRAVYSRNQLHERMVDFWTNHFAIYAKKQYSAWRKPEDDLKVVRENALGSFPEMVRASAHSPAMLVFLDNQMNRVGVATENYARELLELHTLGVDGGYTFKDVKEVARCFTGWTVEDRFLHPRGRFRFNADLHDRGAKVVLGHRIPAGGGVEDGERVLDIVINHPSTARHISRKLCRHFLGEAGDAWVDRTAATYTRTHGSISDMIRPILESDDLLTSPPVVRRPFDFVVAALRALEATTDGGRGLQRALALMGQPLFEWPMPDGYPADAAAWSGSMLARWNFASALVAGRIPGTTVDLKALGFAGNKRLAEVVPTVLDVDAHDRRALAKGTASSRLAVALMSPEFQWS